mmetsp:Transcript_53461/g.114336  ORF Transcript_53461/g.114336 Transcript_53461/m.114336 type:complete len:129 (-) Transcript_53461:3952-4338(-)
MHSEKTRNGSAASLRNPLENNWFHIPRGQTGDDPDKDTRNSNVCFQISSVPAYTFIRCVGRPGDSFHMPTSIKVRNGEGKCFASRLDLRKDKTVGTRHQWEDSQGTTRFVAPTTLLLPAMPRQSLGLG